MIRGVLDVDEIESLMASGSPVLRDDDLTQGVDYSYDPFDRRIKKEVDGNGDGDLNDVDDDEVRQYVYDGQNIILAFDGDGYLTNRYLHGPAVDMILADEQYDLTDEEHADPETDPGVVYWPLTDRLGTVRDLVDNAAVLVHHVEYDAHGNVVGEFDGEGTPHAPGDESYVDHIFGYTGLERDFESGLLHSETRYLDPVTGRWMSEDWIVDDLLNTYRYVRNSPTNLTDPRGLDPNGAQSPSGSHSSEDEPWTPEQIAEFNRQWNEMAAENARIQRLGLGQGILGRAYRVDNCHGYMRELFRLEHPELFRPRSESSGPGVLDGLLGAARNLVNLVKDIWGNLKNLTPEEREAVIGLLQTVLDIVGIFEPTPFADGTSAGISAYNGDWWGLGISVAGFIPWFGDIAKFFRVGKWLDKIKAAIDAARKSEKLAELIRPLVKAFAEFLDKLPLHRLPDEVSDAIKSIRGKLDDFLKGPKKAPKPSPKFVKPTNPPQPPPATLPPGHTVRKMPPTEQYPDGYWVQHNQFGQPVDPSTGKPPSNVSRPEARAQTHVPLPPQKG